MLSAHWKSWMKLVLELSQKSFTYLTQGQGFRKHQYCVPQNPWNGITEVWGGPYTNESGSWVRLGLGSNEPNSSVCGSPRSYVCREINPSQTRMCMGRLRPKQWRVFLASVIWVNFICKVYRQLACWLVSVPRVQSRVLCKVTWAAVSSSLTH
jgi:hypothetical protein